VGDRSKHLVAVPPHPTLGSRSEQLVEHHVLPPRLLPHLRKRPPLNHRFALRDLAA